MRRLAVVILLGLLLNAGPSWAHDDSPTGQTGPASPAPELTRAIDGLTQRLLDLSARHQHAVDSDARKTTLRDLLAVAAARQQRLAALIEDDPGAVIRAALAAHARAALPREALRYLEENVTLEGEVDVLHEDHPGGGRYVHWLRLGSGRLSMNFAAKTPALQSGDRVRVRALRVLHALAVGGANEVSVTGLAAYPNTFGAQKTAVILVTFSNQPGVASVSATQANDIVFGSGASVSNFFFETSYQQTWLTGNIFGPYPIAISGASSCDYWGIATAAEAAATAAGVNLSTYSRRVYAFPSNNCAWWGLGSVGGSPSMAWINGSFANSVLVHEMGHNLGLYHSHALECGSATIAASCSSVEYGDVLDSMGSASPPKHYNAAQKERLGWLNYGSSPPITTVQSTGTYTIDPYESMGTNPKALKVRTASGDWYYIEYRQPIGFDASTIASTTNVKNGVVVHLMDNGDANGIYLLDMTPSTSSWSDPALGVDQSFVDTAGGVTISPVSTSAANASVTITFGNSACVRRNPTVSVSPAQQQGAPGVTASYTVAVTNNDTGCTSSSFSQQVTAPAGWTATFSISSLMIGPGASATVGLSVKAPTTVLPGVYGITPKAINDSAPSYTGLSAATYVVSTPCVRKSPTVAISPADQQGAPGLAVSYAVSVTNNDVGCSASSFTQQATLPAGWTATFGTGSLTINAGATASTPLNVKSPTSVLPGTYSITSKATNAALPTYFSSGAATYSVPSPCVRRAPTVTISPAQQQGAPGVAATYIVAIKNNDTGCTSSNFSQQATVPAGWTASFGALALSLDMGATASTALSVKPPLSAIVGTYNIVPKITNTASTTATASATATYAVANSGGGDTGGGGDTVTAAFTDNFARDDGPIGSDWTVVKGDFAIQNGELRSSATRALHMAVVPQLAGSKVRASANFASVDSNLGPRFGVIVRYRDPNNYYMCYRVTGGTSALRISKVVNGVEVLLKSVPVGNPAKDVMFNLACRADASTLSLEFGGVVKATASDSTFSSGSMGLFMGYSWLLGGTGPSHRADDFRATVQ